MGVLVATCCLVDSGSTDDAVDRCLHMLVLTLSNDYRSNDYRSNGNDYRSINSAADSNMDKGYQAGMHASKSKHQIT